MPREVRGVAPPVFCLPDPVYPEYGSTGRDTSPEGVCVNYTLGIREVQTP